MNGCTGTVHVENLVLRESVFGGNFYCLVKFSAPVAN